MRTNNSDWTNEWPCDNWRFRGKLRSVIGENRANRNDLRSSNPVPDILWRSKGKATTCGDSRSIIPNMAIFPWDFFAKVKFIRELRQILIYLRAAPSRFHTRENIFHNTREGESRRRMENRHSRRFSRYRNATPHNYSLTLETVNCFSQICVHIAIYLIFGTIHFAWLLSATAFRLHSMYHRTCTMITHISEKMCVQNFMHPCYEIRYLQPAVIWMQIMLFLVNQLSIYFYSVLVLQRKSGIIQLFK